MPRLQEYNSIHYKKAESLLLHRLPQTIVAAVTGVSAR